MAKPKLYQYSEDAPKSLSEVRLVELNPGWCRDNGMLAPVIVDVPTGAVLAKDDTGKYVPYLAAAGDNQAIAVLVAARPASAEDQPCVVFRRGVKVASSGLAFLDSVTDADQQTAFTQLTELGIVVEE